MFFDVATTLQPRRLRERWPSRALPCRCNGDPKRIAWRNLPACETRATDGCVFSSVATNSQHVTSCVVDSVMHGLSRVHFGHPLRMVADTWVVYHFPCTPHGNERPPRPSTGGSVMLFHSMPGVSVAAHSSRSGIFSLPDSLGCSCSAVIWFLSLREARPRRLR